MSASADSQLTRVYTICCVLLRVYYMCTACVLGVCTACVRACVYVRAFRACVRCDAAHGVRTGCAVTVVAVACTGITIRVITRS